MSESHGGLLLKDPSLRPDWRSPEADAYRALYKTTRWKALRKEQLRKEPFRRQQVHCDQPVIATVANHKQLHKGDEDLFFDPDNIESTRKPCHDGLIKREENIGSAPPLIMAAGP